MLHRRLPEQYERRLLELNRDLADSLLQTLSRAQVKGNARPAPIVDGEFQRDERLGCRIGFHMRLRTVADDGLPIDLARPVLAAHAAVLALIWMQRLEGMNHFRLFV